MEGKEKGRKEGWVETTIVHTGLFDIKNATTTTATTTTTTTTTTTATTTPAAVANNDINNNNNNNTMGWIKVMVTARYFWHGCIHSGITVMYLQYSRPLIYHLLPNVWKTSYTISASNFVDVPYWPPYRTDKFFSCIIPGHLQWFFPFGEEIVIAWTQIGWVRWMLHNLSWLAAQDVPYSSSGVTPCTVMKNDGILCHQMSPRASLSPWKHSCVLRYRATSCLIQERCSSFVKVVLGRSHYPYDSKRSTDCIDWQNTVAAGSTNTSNILCSCPQSWQV